MVSNKFFYSSSPFFCCIRLDLIVCFQLSESKQNMLSNKELLLIIPMHQLVAEITLIASIRVLARLRARFASIACLLPSALLKLASAFSRAC